MTKRFKVQNMIKGFIIGDDVDLETLQELVEEYGSTAKMELFITNDGKNMTYEEVEALLNTISEENEQLKNRLKDWHQRAFKAHEYFNILEKIIDEVCDNDINNQIWKEYEKREKLIE